jgi:hypothetical protein
MVQKQDNTISVKKTNTPKAKADKVSAQKGDTKKLPKGFEHLGDLFSRFELEDSGGYISQEFQDYGYRLAVELDDMKHKSLYIKLAKTEERGVLEQARIFVSDATTARSKARLFMWKIKQIKQEKSKK